MLNYIMTVILLFVFFIIGYVTSLLRTRSVNIGTLFINKDATDPEGAFAYIQFNDDPAIFIDERYVTLEVKTISQK